MRNDSKNSPRIKILIDVSRNSLDDKWIQPKIKKGFLGRFNLEEEEEEEEEVKSKRSHPIIKVPF